MRLDKHRVILTFHQCPINTRPPTITQDVLDDKLQRVVSKCLVNYGFSIGATADNLPDLRTAKPACGIKIFMGSMKEPLWVGDEEALDGIFSQGDRLIAVHAEDPARIHNCFSISQLLRVSVQKVRLEVMEAVPRRNLTRHSPS